MFHAVRWTLRQRRYAVLALTSLFVALICLAAGTFEIHRYSEKTHANSALRRNVHTPAMPLSTALVPLVGAGPAPTASAIRYRTVTASGRYLPSAQQYLASQVQDGRQGFFVLTPLSTSTGVLLVVRGFVPATASETRPAQIPLPPTGTVTVSGWLQNAQANSDQLHRLGHGEITSVNVAQQSARLGAPTYQAYLTLDAHQPGTAGLATVPLPGLSNPAGGAAEWQLLSYVVQWYAFAALALMLPFFVSRSDVRDAQRRFLGIDHAAEQFDDASPRELPAGDQAGRAGGELVRREVGEVARLDGSATRRWKRAVRLADRYGDSLGPAARPELALRGTDAVPEAFGAAPVRDSAAIPHRAGDAYHGSYNDYLWQLALADGEAPDVLPSVASKSDEFDHRSLVDGLTPRPIQLDPPSPDDAGR